MSPMLKGALTATAMFAIPLAAGISIALLLEHSPRLRRERAACDRYIEQLLHSNDLAEITRAGALVRQIGCDIGRRLPVK